ncbi:MAG: hypothetical protein LUD18_05640, partial [Lachnospiraceae bacterium]|nr:hypothetical protein [Lachnospiraceae bacterium]
MVCSKIKDYPVGLLEALEVNEVSEEQIDYGNLTADQKHGLEAMLLRLSERERDMLLRRYKEKMTLTAIGEYYGISCSRARQIVHRGLVKMGTPDSLPYIVRGYDAQREYIEKINVQRKDEAGLRKKQIISDMESVKLVDLEFPPRMRNRLIGHGIMNLADLVKVVSRDGWYKKIRGIGVKSADEIVRKLEDIGAVDQVSDEKN